MAEQGLVNPRAAFTTVTTFVSGTDADGVEIPYGRMERSYRANAAIAVGEALMWVSPTSTAPVSVTPMTVASDPRGFAGIALEVAAAGGTIRICTEGHCLVFANAQTVAANDVVLVPGANTGEASFTATDPAAATIVGTVLGVAFGVKLAATNLAPIYLRVV